MIGGTMCAMGAAYTLQINRHTRIDIFYMLISIRKRLLIDIIGMLVLFFPAVFFLTRFSWIRAINAWKILEKGSYGFWYPPLYPYRTIIAIGFTLLLIQGLAKLVRDIYHFKNQEKLC
jgi:TRAP-type mannitol/chloroaromatic compound transport system permease small subunit